MIDESLDPGRAAEHRLQVRKYRKLVEIRMHKGEVFDIRQFPGIRPGADFQIGDLFCERIPPGLGVANTLVEIDEEQRHNLLLCSLSAAVPARGLCQDWGDCWPKPRRPAAIPAS